MDTIHKILQDLIIRKGSEINDWISHEYGASKPLLFSSVDIRDSGRKVVPVDTNIFPGGFNNINKEDLPHISKLLEGLLNEQKIGQKIILIPEDHTRNQFYLDNVEVLKNILQAYGREIEIVSVDNLIRNNNTITTAHNFIPDAIILNNDFSKGIPEILKNIAQPIIPSLEYGWHSRTKSQHFHSYQVILSRFCNEFKLDPFFLSARFYSCGNIDFQTLQGVDCVANYVEKMMSVLKSNYTEYGIEDEPYVFVKADSGTYGMGIMVVKSGDEIYNMNKKLRKKMHTIKDGMINEKVIIQEGVKTIVTYKGQVAEPMIYLVGGKPVQNLLRINASRNEFESLNKTGVEFVNFKSNETCTGLPGYLLVSELASLAAAKEIVHLI